MKKFEEKILIEILKDKELDIFGIFKKGNKTTHKDKEKQRKNLLNYYKMSTKKLIECYGKDGAIHYLKILFKDDANCEVSE